MMHVMVRGVVVDDELTHQDRPCQRIEPEGDG
jgi:hypothetical protein